MLKYIAVGLICALVVADAYCYCIAKWPERMRYRWWPIGSGFMALYKFGRD